MKKILFISHDATLTGAPILLLNLIKLITQETKVQCKVVIKNGLGDSTNALLKDFESVVPILVWNKKSAHTKLERLKNIFSLYILKYFRMGKNIDKKIQQWIDESDLVFSNTITNGDILRYFDFSKKNRIVSYIHELEIATEFYTNQDDISVVKSISNKFIVPSDAVASHLVNNLDISNLDIQKLNYYIPLKVNIEALSARQKLNENFSVGIVGTLDWRKGCDLISVIVSTFFKKYKDAKVNFYWQGANLDSIEYKRIAYELKKLGLNEKINFLPPSKDLTSFYQSIDLFLLISKEDPYPLVVLEAASFSKPLICFANVGGASEFIKEDAGSVVPFLDINQLSGEIFKYYTDRILCIEKGKNAFKKYHKLHNDKKSILTEFFRIVEFE